MDAPFTVAARVGQSLIDAFLNRLCEGEPIVRPFDLDLDGVGASDVQRFALFRPIDRQLDVLVANELDVCRRRCPSGRSLIRISIHAVLVRGEVDLDRTGLVGRRVCRLEALYADCLVRYRHRPLDR